jgi:3-hydroxyisobutyrate dehydrogenase-like beta-hydroxyacid dehydrogenase
MGRPIAERLCAGGVRLAVYDRRADALAALPATGVTRCESPRAVADLAPIVFVSLPTPDDVRSVAVGEGGIVHGARVRTYVDLSTTGPTVAAEVAEVLTARRIDCLDAPVSGGPARAASGDLTVMAAGPRATFEELRPLLERFSSKVVRVGDNVGQAQALKVINNLLSAGAIALTGEALALAAKEQMDLRLVLDVLNASSGRNTATEDKFPRCVLPRTFDFGFRLKLMSKDVELCLAEANRLGVPMLVGGAVHQMWQLGASRAADDDDATSIVKLVEEWSGVEIRDTSEQDDTETDAESAPYREASRAAPR